MLGNSPCKVCKHFVLAFVALFSVCYCIFRSTVVITVRYCISIGVGLIFIFITQKKKMFFLSCYFLFFAIVAATMFKQPIYYYMCSHYFFIIFCWFGS